MFKKGILFAISICALLTLSHAKIYSKCQFVNEIRNYVPQNQVAVWSCIAQHEYNYNTAAVSAGGDLGIIQINQQYWCSFSGSPGGGCNSRCTQYLDDFIADDFACAKIIYDESVQLRGNGFRAWTTYDPYCAGDVSQYVAGC